MRYAGLTDDAKLRRREHGNPIDFGVMQQFRTEASAKLWLSRMLARGYEKDIGGNGWKYGYTFSM